MWIERENVDVIQIWDIKCRSQSVSYLNMNKKLFLHHCIHISTKLCVYVHIYSQKVHLEASGKCWVSGQTFCARLNVLKCFFELLLLFYKKLHKRKFYTCGSQRN